MKFFFKSVFNDVLGPVMRGPSSSHTAGSHRIATVCRDLFGELPSRADLTFDPDGSYAHVYRQQGADRAFAAGFLKMSLTGDKFFDSLEIARNQGLSINFAIEKLVDAGHPNSVEITLSGTGRARVAFAAASTGGGGFLISKVNQWDVDIDGKSFELLIECEQEAEPRILELAERFELGTAFMRQAGGLVFFHFKINSAPEQALLDELRDDQRVRRIWDSEPVFFIAKNEPIFRDYSEILKISRRSGLSLGRIMIDYESCLLGMSREEISTEMKARYSIMMDSCTQGMNSEKIHMQLLTPSAEKIERYEKSGKAVGGGIQLRAALKALAAMHTSNSMGVVCAAPTGGAAGVIPGVINAMAEEKILNESNIVQCLMAAGGIGLLIAYQATFAAEEAGCQVEIGAAGAMAAAAVVEAAGGGILQAMDAAAISLQNTMGSVCDLVQGMCEIPCHTRNAVSASSAFTCADLILGGYTNPIPLNETIDAVYSSGKMLPKELRCTSLGGLAVTPTGSSLPIKKWKSDSIRSDSKKTG